MKYFKVNLAEIPNNDTDVRKITAVNDDLVKRINKDYCQNIANRTRLIYL